MANIPPYSPPQGTQLGVQGMQPNSGASLQLLVDAAQANTRLLGEIQQALLTLTAVSGAITSSTTVLSSIQHAILTVFPQGSTLTATATAGSAVLPATPAKFMTVQATDGNAYKVALYLS